MGMMDFVKKSHLHPHNQTHRPTHHSTHEGTIVDGSDDTHKKHKESFFQEHMWLLIGIAVIVLIIIMVLMIYL